MTKKNLLLILILALATLLRIWRLDLVPVSLFGDEVDVGYQAYSILKTGRDYLGNFLPINVYSLADIKPAFYSYMSVPTVAIFGISPYGVRLPAAFFGILGVWFFYLLVNKMTENTSLALLSAFLLAISPWHMQYSRWGAEMGAMIAFYFIGVFFFLKSFLNSRWLILSAIFLGFSIWTYHGAKVFIPISILAMLIIWRKKIVRMSKIHLTWSGFGLMLIVFPIFLSSLSGGINRFGSTSIFNNGETTSKVTSELQYHVGQLSFVNELLHNRFLSWSNVLITNYLHSFSFEFLFISGDLNTRHNVSGSGEFYKFQLLFLIIGLIFFTLKKLDQRIKILLLIWLISAPLPSILTEDGGNHASRLFFLLPILIFLISMGIYYCWESFRDIYRQIFVVTIVIVVFTSFMFNQHNYWVHYPKISEKWWHAGFKEAIQSAVSKGGQYDNVIISQADEPALIFFLGWSQYPPSEFQRKYPLVKENMEGIGEVSRLDKYYFPPIGRERGLYELGSILPKNTLYLATAKEIRLDLIKEPQRVPSDLTLIQSVTYPSGIPAFYLFKKAYN